jgi:prolyl-tRNA synthetase
VRGSDELEETKAQNSVDALELIDATLDEIKDVGVVAGYCGLVNLPKDILVVVDSELENSQGMVCGGNEDNFHFINVDLKVIENIKYFDLIAVKEEDTCACCGGKLSYTKGIEAGHIFQLGDKYSKAMNATFLDENGKAKPFIMGCYGIGVSRLVAAVIEQNHDEKGCIWTKSTTPFMVDIIVSNSKNEDEKNMGEKIYEELKASNVEVILDDRINARFGFKIGDFELLGFPYAIIIGKKLLDGIVEIVDRKTLLKTEVKIEEVVSKILNLIK